MAWFLHPGCPARESKQGKDPAGWWSDIQHFGGNLTCSGCGKEFLARNGKNLNFNPNERVLPSSPSSPSSKPEGGARPSQLVIGAQPLIVQSPRAGISGGKTVEAQPSPGQDTLTPMVHSSPTTKPAALPTATMGATATIAQAPKLTFSQLRDLKTEVEKQLKRAGSLYAEAEELYKSAEKQNAVAVENIKALPDDNGKKAELNEKVTDLDSRLASSKLKHSNIQSRLNPCKVRYEKLGESQPNPGNRDHVTGYPDLLNLVTTLAGETDVLVQEARPLNAEVNQLVSAVGQLVGAAKLLVVGDDLTYEQLQAIQQEIENQLKRARILYAETEELYKDAESQKVILVANVNALSDEDGRKAELGEKATNWDSRLASSKLKHNDIQSRLGSCDGDYKTLSKDPLNVKNKDQVKAYRAQLGPATKLVEDTNMLVQEARLLNEEVKQLTSDSGKLVAAARLLVAATTERANNVNPRTIKQAALKKDYEACANETIDQKRDKMAKAKALLDQVGVDAVAQTVTNEKEYVRLREQQAPRLEAAAKLDPPLGANTSDAEAYKAIRSAFDEANRTYLVKSSDLANRSKADRFTEALQALKMVKEEADMLLRTHANRLASELDIVLTKAEQMPEKGRDPEIGVKARQLANAASPMGLQSLTAEQQAKLLKALRKAPEEGEHNVDHLQTKVYLATKLEKDFLREEKNKRTLVIQALTGNDEDKAELMKARDTWPPMEGETLNENEVIRIFTKIVKAHCSKMDFAEPQKIQLYDDKPSTSGGFLRDGKIIQINRKGDTFNDFELVMDSIFHENSHNWQLQLVERLRGERQPPIEEGDPLYKQALLFEANQGDDDKGYDKGAGYKAQPKEAHAHRAGPKTAGALMRALV